MRTMEMPTRAAARPASRATGTRGAWLFGDDVLKGRPAQYREHGVVKPEKGEVAARIVGHARADAAHDERDGEGQEQEGQDELAGTARRRHRGEQRPDGANADARQEDA